MPENNLKKMKDIFEKAKKGDKESFSEIYETYFKPLYRYIYLKIDHKAESDDLVQDIFIKALNLTEDSSLRDSSLIIHFYDVARRSVIDWKRKRRRTSPFDEGIENYYDANVGKTDEDMTREEFDNLRRAMRELSDERQDALIFKFISNLSNKEIESILGISARSAIRLEAQSLISIRDILKKQYERQS